ncbi:hypothetical protein VNO80_15594 [Phaseolus coccineus]|uniref:Cytochrome c oxidase subunit 5C n=1 Tax=Phaseolus coccineus TaxID=3886 RepID=A0AAN9MK49_PHACN
MDALMDVCFYPHYLDDRLRLRISLWGFRVRSYNFDVLMVYIAHATLKGPSVVKEIIIGAVLGLAAGSVWKMHHWNEQRKIRTFYDLLEKGEIGVVLEEQ